MRTPKAIRVDPFLLVDLLLTASVAMRNTRHTAPDCILATISFVQTELHDAHYDAIQALREVCNEMRNPFTEECRHDLPPPDMQRIASTLVGIAEAVESALMADTTIS